MTGSLLFNRQHSSTTGHSNINKMNRPKLRRCSSADDHNSIEVTPDDNHHKEKFFIKRDSTPSDNDSGVEDLDQQVVNYVCSQSNNVDEEEPSAVFGACEDEVIEEYLQIIPQQIKDPEQQALPSIHDDLILAAQVTDNEKKDFCSDTSEVFHGEFAGRIACPIALKYPGIHYYLFVEDGVVGDPCQWPNFAFVKLDNAKAQFKCPNIHCRRLWTSMRARISFKISYPQPNGFVVLKIYGQNCQHCETPADALWYIEEVCRVMENLTKEIFNVFFPSMINDDYLQGTEIIENVNKHPRRLHHDPKQRKGKMRAPHDKTHCEACQHGWCFS